MNNTKSEDWLKITINENPVVLEELSTIFFDIGCQGIEEHNDQFTLYFHIEALDDGFKTRLSDVLLRKNISVDKVNYCKITDENWIENWKKNFKPFTIGRKIVVKPDWEIYQSKVDEQVITITPKMAFGTGHHETTQLVLMQLEELIRPGMCVLDAGTGSAILAIYSALKGAENVVAFDIDPVAIENARENIQLNKVDDKITLECGSLNEIIPQQFDVIIANINRNILLDLAVDFKMYAGQNTILILSGLLITDRKAILDKYSKYNWQYLKSETQGEWLSLNFVYSEN